MLLKHSISYILLSFEETKKKECIKNQKVVQRKINKYILPSSLVKLGLYHRSIVSFSNLTDGYLAISGNNSKVKSTFEEINYRSTKLFVTQRRKQASGRLTVVLCYNEISRNNSKSKIEFTSTLFQVIFDVRLLSLNHKSYTFLRPQGFT